MYYQLDRHDLLTLARFKLKPLASSSSTCKSCCCFAVNCSHLLLSSTDAQELGVNAHLRLQNKGKHGI